MTTTNLNKPRAHWYDLPVPAAAGITIFAIYLIIGLVWQLRSAQPTAAAVPTPALDRIIVIATSAPVAPAPTSAAVVAAVLPNALRRAVVAYDAPAGNVLGAIEQGRAYTVLARYGSDWLQVDVSGSGVVWLKSSEVLDLPNGLADLEPTDAPQVVYVSVPAPAYAAPTPVPEQYQVVNAPAVLAPQQLVILDREQWAMDAQRAGR